MENKKWFNLKDRTTFGLTIFILIGSLIWQIAINWVDGITPWVVIGMWGFFFAIVIPLHWLLRDNQ